MYTYKMEIGDWSHDGHNQSEIFILETSHTNTEIQKAYKKACKKANIELHGHGLNSVLSEYEDSGLTAEDIEKLDSLGIDVKNLETLSTTIDEVDGSTYCCPEDVVILFMEMAKSQLKDFSYKIVSDKMPEIQAPGHEFMGYGCFN